MSCREERGQTVVSLELVVQRPSSACMRIPDQQIKWLIFLRVVVSSAAESPAPFSGIGGCRREYLATGRQVRMIRSWLMRQEAVQQSEWGLRSPAGLRPRIHMDQLRKAVSYSGEWLGNFGHPGNHAGDGPV